MGWLFPPRQPRRRRRWFHELLDTAATLHAVRTKSRRSPRMVKRRNSPYASFDRKTPRRVPIDWTPAVITTIAARQGESP
jgi:hypothetical protein